MTKEELIAEVVYLYEELRDNEHSNWYRRDTMTKWEDSLEYRRYNQLEIDQEKLIQNIESSF